MADFRLIAQLLKVVRQFREVLLGDAGEPDQGPCVDPEFLHDRWQVSCPHITSIPSG